MPHLTPARSMPVHKVLLGSFLCIAMTVLVAMAATPGRLSASDPPVMTSEEPSEVAAVEVVTRPGLSDTELEAAQSELRAADEAFNRALATRDRDATKILLTTEVVFLDEEVPRVGKLEFLNLLQPAFEDKLGFTFEGETVVAHVARSGELGYTIGKSTLTYKQPWDQETTVDPAHYLTIWTRTEQQPWRIRQYSDLIVHRELGRSSDPRATMMRYMMFVSPELADQVGATTHLEWTPETTIRSAAGDMAYSYGTYLVRFTQGEEEKAGKGYFGAVWEKDEQGLWVMAGEGYTPPVLDRQP